MDFPISRPQPLGDIINETFMQALPEGDAILDRWRHLDRAEAGDVLVLDPAVDAAGLDEAHL